eukprot:COSAG01_NODE_59609_length_299_cov_1.025000_1_plen_42_part_01
MALDLMAVIGASACQHHHGLGHHCHHSASLAPDLDLHVVIVA